MKRSVIASYARRGTRFLAGMNSFGLLGGPRITTNFTTVSSNEFPLVHPITRSN
ncbi:hypothetical protein QWZ13_11570 [Reinekea marina]|uniref:hypothetical protein n=1 Tax=Reinekea marina TaxID=1310421 RepID=UPI0025B4E7EA|nr:hypothetical protein [Reinekea marina]MDN3649554.1 hypothetical protein [Reinekea marina]